MLLTKELPVTPFLALILAGYALFIIVLGVVSTRAMIHNAKGSRER